jgi:hypothetical protein
MTGVADMGAWKSVLSCLPEQRNQLCIDFRAKDLVLGLDIQRFASLQFFGDRKKSS